MNQIYKSLWNISTGTTVTVPETAMAAGQQVTSTRGARRALARVQTQRLALEPRIVFDGALPVAAVDMMESTPDHTQLPAVEVRADSVATSDSISANTQTEAVQDSTNDSKNIESLTLDVARALPSDSAQERVLIEGTLAPTDLTSNEIIFIDAQVSDLESYITDHPNADVVLIDSSQDGLAQIAAVLAGRSDIDAIHILSHGTSGQFNLGDTVVSLQSINTHADELAVIKAALSVDADILIYGCDVAAGDAGQMFVEALANATGADIAASTDTTGAESLGGDWVLESTQSHIEANTITASDWSGKLGGSVPVNNVPSSQAVGMNGNLVFSAANGNAVSITDPDGENQTIVLSSTNGTLTLSGITNLTFTAGDGTTDATMTFSGLVTDINAALNGLTFTPTANYSGAAQISIKNTDPIAPASTWVNGGFEQGTTTTSYVQINETSVPGWDTDASDSLIEIWHDGYGFGPVDGPNRVPADSGSYFAELNATQAAALFQEFAVVPNSTVTFSFAHRGRLGTDVMQVNVYDLGADNAVGGTGANADRVLFTQNYSDGNTAWGAYSGTVTSNSSGHNLRFEFRAISSAGGNISVGNFLDSIVVNRAFSSSNSIDVAVVNTVNDAPLNSVPAAQSTLEDTAIVFSSALGNAIQISDVDAGAGVMTVTLWAENGAITLAQTTGLTFSTHFVDNPAGTMDTAESSGSNDATMRFSGTMADINAALNGLSFTPTANNNGAGRITIRTEDNGNTGTGGNLSDTDSVNIDFIPVKDTVTDNVVTNEETPVVISPLTNDTFGAGNAFLTGVGTPTNGTAVLNAGTGTTTYTPNANFNGTDSYTYTSTTIDPGFKYEYFAVNQENNGTYDGTFSTGFPTTAADATGWTATISGDDSARIQEHQNDADNETTIRWSGVVLIEQAGTYTFSLNADNAARLFIDGNPVVTVGWIEDTLTGSVALAAGVHTFQLEYADADIQQIVALSYAGLDTGGADVNVNNDKHWGSAARTETDTIVITVNPVNDAPIAVDDGTVGSPIVIAEDTPSTTLNVLGNDTDADNDTLSIQSINGTVITPGTAYSIPVPNGTVNVSTAGIVTFTPAPNYTGPIAFDYVVQDPSGATDTGTVHLSITPVNDAPVALPVSATGVEDTPLAVALTGTDIDGTVTSVIVSSLPPATQGILTKADGTPVVAGVSLTPTEAAGLVFVPAPNFNGVVNPIAFTVTDNESGISSPAAVNLTLTAVNDSPVAIAGSVNTFEDMNTPISLIGTDVDGSVVGVTVTTLPLVTEGVVTLSDGTLITAGQLLTPAQAANLIFVPALNFNGVVNFPFTVIDNLGATSAPAIFTIDVADVDDDPVATPQIISTPEDTPIAVSLTGTDAEGPITAVTITSLPPASQGILTLADGTPVVVVIPLTPAEAAGLIFNPAPNFNGSANVSFTVTDSAGQVSSPPAALTLNVTPVNDAPVAVDESIVVNEDSLNNPSLVSLLANDADVDGPALTLMTVGTFTTTAGGTITIAADGSYIYTPLAGYIGPDSFNYTVTDGSLTDTGTLNITVAPVNDAPVALDDNLSVNEDSLNNPSMDSLLANDTDIDGPTLAIAPSSIGTFTTTAGGTITITASGSYIYTPLAGYMGADSFNYTVTDGSLTDTGTLNIVVNAVNDAPVAVGDSVTIVENTPVVLNLIGNDTDADGDTLTLSSIHGNTITLGTPQTISVPNGTVNVSATGVVTFTPAPNYTGPISFDYEVQDPSGASDTGTVTVNVTAANQPAVTSPAGETVLFEQLLPQPIHFGDEHYPGEHVLQTHGLPAGMPEDIFVSHSVRESQNQVTRNSALGLINADTPTANELNNFTFDLNGLPVGMDPHLFVQHAVRGLPVAPEHNLFVQHAVRQSQLESKARNIGVTSFNSASVGVASVLSPFELGAPHAAMDLSVDGVQGEFANIHLKTDSLNTFSQRAEIEHRLVDAAPVVTEKSSNETNSVANQPRAAASFSHQLHLAAQKLKPSASIKPTASALKN